MENLRRRQSNTETVGSVNFSENPTATGYTSARIWCWSINLISTIVAIWGLLALPARMDAIMAMALFPVAALITMNRFEGIAQFDAPRERRRPSTLLAFFFPSTLLALRGMMYWNILRWSTLCIPAFAFSLLLFALSLWLSIEARQKRAVGIILSFICVFYGFGVTVNLNGALANSHSVYFQARVLEKLYNTGRYAYEDFVLSPWGPQKQTNRVSVQDVVYRRHRTGDIVSITVTNGALGIPFYSIK